MSRLHLNALIYLRPAVLVSTLMLQFCVGYRIHFMSPVAKYDFVQRVTDVCLKVINMKIG